MLARAVEIAGDRRHLCKERGFLAVYSQGERLGRLALDELGVVLVAGHGVSYTNELMVALAKRCVPLFTCNKQMLPVGCFWSLDGHHLLSQRVRAQAAASRPLQKRLWQQIIKAKIALQAQVARSCGVNPGPILNLANNVRSGDPDNLEAAAARLYWQQVFGPSFKRRRKQSGVNSLLNYAYTIIRSATARAVMLAGLHPALSIFHKNARNTMPLVDDIMEPYRPFADLFVLKLIEKGCCEVDKDSKQDLCALPTLDIIHGGTTKIVAESLKKCTDSLANVYLGKQRSLSLPEFLCLDDQCPEK